MSHQPVRRRSRHRRLVAAALSAVVLSASALTATPAQAAAAPTGCSPYAFANSAGVGYDDCGGAVRQLTNNAVPYTDDQPAVAPDGTKVAVRHIAVGGRSEIMVVDVATGATTLVSHLGGFAADPTWSPDSRQIVFRAHLADEDAATTVYQVGADGGGLTTLKTGSWAVGTAWCRNGKIAFVDDGVISTMNSDGSGEAAVVPAATDRLAWTPNCTHILYSGPSVAPSGGTAYNIEAVPAAGGTPVQVTGFHGYAFDPSVSPNWTLAVYGAPASGGAESAYIQWLGGNTESVMPGSASYIAVAYRPGDSSIAAPAGFPIDATMANCPTAKLFGLRGSSEKWNEFGGFGRTIASYKNRMATKISGLAAEPVDYPAIPVDVVHTTYTVAYDDSVSEGKGALVAHVRQFIASCPKTYVIFAGYSQGADVVLMSMREFTAAERKHVAAVDFFGNPHFNPKQVRVNIGEFNPRLAGVYFTGSSDNIPSSWVALTNSYCTVGDPVCNFSGRNVATCLVGLGVRRCAHQLYPNRGWTKSAADASAAKWKKMPKLR